MPTVTAVIGTLLPPTIPSGAQIYDMIMGQIEPELTTDQTARLEQIAAGETPAQIKKRAQRYKRAFEEYDKRFESYVASLREQVHSYQRIVAQRCEQEEHEAETVALQNLESGIHDA